MVREYREVIKHITGDIETAKTHIPSARNFLGDLKQRMQLGGLSQDSFSRVMQDGSSVYVESRFGVDKIRIHSPHRPKKKRNRPFLWVGARITSGGLDTHGNLATALHLCVWEPGDDPDIISNRAHFIPEGRFPDGADYSGPPGPDVYPLQDPANFIPAGDRTGCGYTDAGSIQISKTNTQGFSTAWGDTVYDEVVIADPDDDAGTGVRAEEPVGLWYVKVMAVGPDCTTVTPTNAEVRIVIGKDANQREFTHNITIQTCTEYNRGILPKGWFDPIVHTDGNPCNDCEEPSEDDGGNVHASHWWQGAGTAIVLPPSADEAGAATFTEPFLLPPTGFVDGQFPPLDQRCVGCRKTYTQSIDDGDSATYSFNVTIQTQIVHDQPNPNGATVRQREILTCAETSFSSGGFGKPYFVTFFGGLQFPKTSALYRNATGSYISWPDSASPLGSGIAYDTGWFTYYIYDGLGDYTYSDIYIYEQTNPYIVWSYGGIDPVNSVYTGGVSVRTNSVQTAGPAGYPTVDSSTQEIGFTGHGNFPPIPPSTETCEKVLWMYGDL